ncbi:MAG TPA: hypothetical protein VFG84_02495 [Gemmatimonadaceae bacterium]|jgi:hypothetical protein|nr:hypothetical protein [Gemmatimonadaceae bacterium]
MRRVLGCLVLSTVVACAPGEEAAVVDTTAAAAVAPPAAALTADMLVGTWSSTAKMDGSDSVVSRSTVTTSMDSTGALVSSIQFEGASEAMPMRLISMAGDSIVQEFGPYHRSNVATNPMVTTTIVTRVMGDHQMGTWVARPVSAADPVVSGTFEAMRMP